MYSLEYNTITILTQKTNPTQFVHINSLKWLSAFKKLHSYHRDFSFTFTQDNYKKIWSGCHWKWELVLNWLTWLNKDSTNIRFCCSPHYNVSNTQLNLVTVKATEYDIDFDICLWQIIFIPMVNGSVVLEETTPISIGMFHHRIFIWILSLPSEENHFQSITDPACHLRLCLATE